MKGFVLPIILLLLAIIALLLQSTMHSMQDSSLTLNIFKSKQQLLQAAKIQINMLAASLPGNKISTPTSIAPVQLLASSYAKTTCHNCETQAYWLDAELIWQNLKLRVSSRWALFTNAGDNCAQFMPGWRQTDWKET